MADDNNQDIKKQQQTEATKNAAVNAAKMYGGPLGAGVNLASKTKLGNAILNKGAEAINKQNPALAKAASILPKGNSDLINNNQKTSQSANGANTNVSDTNGNINDAVSNGAISNADNANYNDSKASTEGEVQSTSPLTDFWKKHWIKIVTVISGALLFLILIFVIYFIVASVSGGVIEFFTHIGDSLIGFFTEDEEKQMHKYYDELQRVKDEIYRTKGICIDENLITATLTVNVDAKEYNDSMEDEVEVEDDPNSDVAAIPYDYKKMTKEVGLLANMQIKNIKYGHNKDILSGKIDCRSKDEGPDDQLVNGENLGLLEPATWWEKFIKFLSSEEAEYDKYVSDSPDLVSQHDLTSFAKFFTKKINEERNFEYHIYTPAYQEVCHTGSNGAITCQDECIRESVPSKFDIPSLSIGELVTMEESVYYWNLVNSFIPEYYKDFIPENDGEERDKAIKKIAEDIYLLYKDIGPGQECNSSADSYYAYSDLCPNGVPVKSVGGEIEFVNLEDYVAGVVASENAWHQGDNIESMKAQAIAARSYVLANTDSCKNPIENSSRKQNYKPTNDPYAIRAAMETAGMVLYKNGKILATEYDAFCVSKYDSASGNYILKQKSQAIPKSFVDSDGTFCRGTKHPEQCGCNGHGRGMSQIGARFMQAGGKSYTDILSYYYGDGTGLSTDNPNDPLSIVKTGGVSGDWANWKQYDKAWGDTKLSSCTLSKVGCYVTSLAILIAKSGAKTTLGSSFNPGTFASRLTFDDSCNYDGGFSDVKEVVSSFENHGAKYNYSPLDIANYLKDGYYLQIYITKSNGRPHFVAVDRVVGDTIYIHDPGSSCTTLNGCYPGSRINNIRVFKI